MIVTMALMLIKKKGSKCIMVQLFADFLAYASFQEIAKI